MSLRSDWPPRIFSTIGGLSLLLAFATTTSAEDIWTPVAETQCRLEGWVTDSSPSGVNVRAAPSPNAQLLGTLPPYIKETQEGYAFGVPLSITGSRDGWLRISGARDDKSYTGLAERPAYKGIGWVPGTAIGFAVQSGLGYARPDAGSQKLVDLAGDWLTEMGTVGRVLACSGEWALLEFTLRSKRNPQSEALDKIPPDARLKQRAWFRRICGAQDTTCEGVTD